MPELLPTPTPELAPLGPGELRRLEAFAGAFRHAFPREDQFRRFVAYLAGLVAPGGRKTVRGIAARSAGLLSGEAGAAQALQHFVGKSPWDAGEVFAVCRRLTEARPDPESGWAVHDAAFVKRGRHSAGAQRQFARSTGRKLNCQVAVVLARLGPCGYAPLGARLYLPGQWLRENADLARRTVPEAWRVPRTKAELALGLIDDALAGGFRPASGRVALESGYASAHGLAEGLADRGLEAVPDAGAAGRQFDALRGALGLDHFEGRSWAGWHHHVSLVFAARLAACDRDGAAPAPASRNS